MTRFNPCLASLTLLLAATALPALAESSAASSASDSVSTSVGSISGSIQKSSDSSSKTNNVAEGDYQVIDVAALPERPGMVRVTLHALAEHGAADEFFLTLPQEAFDRGQLAQGRVVTARQRPYGVEFASRDTKQPFFLVLADDWYRDLQTNAVVL
ncbi:MAG TPA: hypothetical protein VJ608_14260 [Albitalea sp.]|nr:hypothetical protein [Albitalea sp.]